MTIFDTFIIMISRDSKFNEIKNVEMHCNTLSSQMMFEDKNCRKIVATNWSGAKSHFLLIVL